MGKWGMLLLLRPLVRKLDILLCRFMALIVFIFEKKLQETLESYNPSVSFRFIFTNKQNIGSFFKIEDNFPKLLRSGIVYLFQCSDCGVRYVGSSVRNLKIRISEHKGFSFRTNRVISNSSFSEIRWSCQNDHVIKSEDFRIIGQCSQERDLRLLESLHIRDLKPKLNKSNSTMKLSLFVS